MFAGPEYASYIALCRELRLEREARAGDWFVDRDPDARPDAREFTYRVMSAAFDRFPRFAQDALTRWAEHRMPPGDLARYDQALAGYRDPCAKVADGLRGRDSVVCDAVVRALAGMGKLERRP